MRQIHWSVLFAISVLILVVGGVAIRNSTSSAAYLEKSQGTPGTAVASPMASPAASPFATPVASLPSSVDVAIRGFIFDPPIVEIAVGGTVTWTEYDMVPHNVVSNTEGSDWASPILRARKTYSYTFESAGTYDYFCALHPAMTGKVIVVE